MIINFLKNPEKKIINIFFDQKQKLSKKQIGRNLLYFKIGKKFNKKNKNIIFSFSKLNEIRNFFKDFKHVTSSKIHIYLVFNAFHAYNLNKFLIFFYLFLMKKKELIFFHNRYTNSFLPDFLYRIKFMSLIKAYIYFFYQLFKNIFCIFRSNIILIKIK